MSVSKARLYLAVAAVVAAGLIVPTGLLSADASTTACGSACSSPTSVSSGEELAVSGSGVVMASASTTNSAEDWTPQNEGTVMAAVSDQIISPRLELQYSSDNVFEFQYAPDGIPSDKCLADGYSNTSSSTSSVTYGAPSLSVTLAPCGVTAATLWIPDNNGQDSEPCDLINAGYQAAYSYEYEGDSTTPADGYASPFAEPAVLTVTTSSSGTSTVGLASLSEIGGVVSATQEWTNLSPQLQAALKASAVRAKAAAEKAS
jgi:hypothetical protein